MKSRLFVRRAQPLFDKGVGMVSIAIVDDDEGFRCQLTDYIKRFYNNAPHQYAVTCFGNGVDFLSGYKCGYDIIILDIQMPFMDGMEVANKLRKVDPTVKIVFITQVASLAIRGYEVSAFDYILKPLDYDNDFKHKFKRIVESVNKSKPRSRDLLINDDNGATVRVSFDELLYVVKDRDYSLFHTTRGVFRKRMTVTAVEKLLDGLPVALVNSGCIVNMHCVKNIDSDGVALTNGDLLVLSRGKKKEFYAKFFDFIEKHGESLNG